MSPRGTRGANFCFPGGRFGRLFRVLFESVFLARFGVDLSSTFSIFHRFPAVRAGSAAEAEAAEGGEASPPSSAWVGFSVFAFWSSTPLQPLTRCGGSTSPSASTRPREVFSLKLEAIGPSLDFKEFVGLSCVCFV